MQQVKHTIPMLRISALENTTSVYSHCLDLLRMGARSIMAEVKLDGLSCDLTYRQGHLELATIRGTDVQNGYDITDIARSISTIPKYIQHTVPLVIRGVLVLPIEVLMERQTCFVDHDCPKSCVREALDTKHPCNPALEYVMTDHVTLDTGGIEHKHFLIREFIHVGSCRINTINGFTERDFINMLGRVNSIKNSNRYDSCGIIVKIRNMLPGSAESEYYTGMFAMHERRTFNLGTIHEGWWVVTKSGRLVPYYRVCEDGRLVICNMYNLRNAIRCGIRVGDTVVLDRRGHSHPIVRGLHASTGTEVLQLETSVCPACGHQLATVGFDQYCTADTCSGRMVSWLRFVTGKSMFDVPNVTDAQLSELWAMCEKSIHPVQIALFKVPTHSINPALYGAIQRHMVIPLYKALALLNIASLSVVTLKNIAQCGSTLMSIFKNCGNMRNERERGILEAWWADAEHRSLVYKMDRFFVYGKPSNVVYDRNVCITGRFSNSRGVLIRKLNALGYGVHGALNKRTTAVLAGDDAGTVVELAKGRKVPIVTSLDELKLL